MSILTHKMKTARKEYIPSSCKLWFPYNEGSGDTITDLASGVVVTDDGSAAHNEPSAITFIATGIVTSGSLPTIASGKSVLMMNVVKSGVAGGTSNLQRFGSISSSYISMDITASVKRGSETATAVSFATQSNDEKIVRVMTFDGVTGVINAYSGIDGATLALDNTGDGSAHLGGLDFTDEISVGVNGLDPDNYGVILYVVDTLPSAADIITAANWAYANWTVGHKTPPPQFANLA